MSANEKNDDLAHREAADWFAIMHSGDVTRETRVAFEDWLHGDTANKLAYREFEQVYRDLDLVAVETFADRATASVLSERIASGFDAIASWLKRPVIGAGLAIACAAMIAVFLPSETTTRAPTVEAVSVTPQLATDTAEIREIQLPDGSMVTLGAKSRIELAFTDERRQVHLLDGEAFFEVSHDPERPFFVAAQDTVVRVVGTKFDVKRSAEIVHVAVLEGIVEVMKSDGTDNISEVVGNDEIEKQVLTAGERVSAARRVALPKTRQVEQMEPGSWRRGRLAYEDASLAEVISDLNRYYDRPIRIGAPKLGDLRSTMAFNTSDIDQVLLVIEAIHPVSVKRLSSGEIIILAGSNG